MLLLTGQIIDLEITGRKTVDKTGPRCHVCDEVVHGEGHDQKMIGHANITTSSCPQDQLITMTTTAVPSVPSGYISIRLIKTYIILYLASFRHVVVHNLAIVARAIKIIL